MFMLPKLFFKNIEYRHVLYFIPFYMIENLMIFFFNVDVLFYAESSQLPYNTGQFSGQIWKKGFTHNWKVFFSNIFFSGAKLIRVRFK